MKITYTHRDVAGDELRLSAGSHFLTVNVTGPNIELNRQAVAALQAFLAEWQECTTPAPPTPPPLSVRFARQAVEQLAEPLCHRSAPADVHHASRCTFCGHLWITHRITDPEPQDVGHPDEPVTAPRQLVGCGCGHRWGAHGGGRCYAEIVPGAGVFCECTRLTQADVNNAPEGCECGHRKNAHSRSLGCLYEFATGEYCTCGVNQGQVHP